MPLLPKSMLIPWNDQLSPFSAEDRGDGYSWLPPVDIYQTDNNFVVEMPLPGANLNDIEVVIDGANLLISGRRERKREIDERDYYQREVRYGSFQRIIALPSSVDSDKAKAEYDQGILKVTIPKTNRGKKISVSVIK